MFKAHLQSYAPVKFIDRSSDKISIRIFALPDLSDAGWWIINFKVKLPIRNLMMTVGMERGLSS